MNEVFKVIKERRSVRRYNNEPLEREIVKQIVEAGRWAPTGGNSQSVHFTVISNTSVLERLRAEVQNIFANMELQEDMYISKKNSIKFSKKGNYIYDYGAPVLVVVSNVKGYPNAMADCACAMENMMLAATSLGVASCWINQLHWLENEESIRSILEQCGIDRGETICASIALGNNDGHYNGLERKGMKVDWVE